MNKYDDIINLPHWDPSAHQRMPLESRAAQFAPFAALVSYDEAIKETARTTEEMEEMDEQTADVMNEKVNRLIERIAEHPEIEVAYFVFDTRKAGGTYRKHKGIARAIDEVQREIIFADGNRIPIHLIKTMTSPIFIDIENRD